MSALCVFELMLSNLISYHKEFIFSSKPSSQTQVCLIVFRSFEHKVAHCVQRWALVSVCHGEGGVRKALADGLHFSSVIVS
jgi:hypothetical protein